MQTAIETAPRPVGRRPANVKLPRGKFTFLELCAANPHLAPLTLRNFMKRDKELGDESQIVRVEEERGEPGSETGYGRKPFLYVRRELMDHNKKTTHVRNVKYHVRTAKAPSHTIKRREITPSGLHAHRIVNVPEVVNGTGASVTVSFAPNGGPIPASVTVNFFPKKTAVGGTPEPEVTVNTPKPEELPKTHEHTILNEVTLPPAPVQPVQPAAEIPPVQPAEATVTVASTTEVKPKKSNGKGKNGKAHTSKATPETTGENAPDITHPAAKEQEAVPA